MRLPQLAFAATAALLAAQLCAGRPFTAHDLTGLYRVGTAATDGASHYVVPVSIWDEETNKKTQSLYLGSTTPETKLVPLDPVSHVSDRNPVFAADGSAVFFLSSREGGLGLWAADPSSPSAAAYRVATFPIAVDNLVLSPSGEYATFSAKVYPGLSLAETAARDAEVAASRTAGAYVFEGLFVRRWDEWWLGTFNHVFVMRLSKSSATGRWVADSTEAVDVMPEFRGDCPARPTSGAEQFAWAPDSSELAFTTQIGSDMAWSTDLNVYTYRLSDGTTHCVSCESRATDRDPSYSPDGRTLAYLAMRTPGYESDTQHIMLRDRATGRSRLLAAAWDRSVDKVQWAPDSRSVIAIAADRGRQSVFSIDVATGAVSKLLGEHNSDGVSQVPCYDDESAACLLYTRSDLTHPADVWVTSSDGTAHQLTDFNAERLADVEFTEAYEYTYKGASGDEIQAWVHMPYGFNSKRKAGAKFPLVLYIHGGPESPWFDSWSYRWNAQTVAAQGYAVIAPNFHGSGSFGENFTRSILGDWGGKPFDDLMMGVDAIVAEYDWVDGTRVAAMGASYGGYMINWLNGNTEDKFRCLICHDGLFDTVDKYYGTDELFFSEYEFGGTPYQPSALATYRKWSPSTFAHKFSTPQLTFQGGKDYRIPETSGISTFTLLQRKGVDSKLIYFPTENHWCSDPNNSLVWHEQALAWLAKYLTA